MMSENNNESNINIEQTGDNSTQATPQSFQLSPEELLNQQRLREENRNPYIAAINKKLKLMNKKLLKLQKLEQLKKAGKELNQSQLESLDSLKSHQKKVSHFDELKKNFVQIWENVIFSFKKKSSPFLYSLKNLTYFSS